MNAKQAGECKTLTESKRGSMSEGVRRPGRKASKQRNSGHEDMGGHEKAHVYHIKLLIVQT